jgi:hypothetical protein
MEQELLMLLDYELRVDEKDLILICAPFLPPASVDRVTAMDRNVPSLISCATSRSTSSDGSNSDAEFTSPELSSVSTPTEPVKPALASSMAAVHKKTKDIEVANSSTTVITRAKSWYGSLRAAASS